MLSDLPTHLLLREGAVETESGLPGPEPPLLTPRLGALGIWGRCLPWAQGAPCPFQEHLFVTAGAWPSTWECWLCSVLAQTMALPRPVSYAVKKSKGGVHGSDHWETLAPGPAPPSPPRASVSPPRTQELEHLDSEVLPRPGCPDSAPFLLLLSGVEGARVSVCIHV